ncbi:YceK/YidQ family lipoprotein [Limnoglobus roseus]|uniref:YceK/YidQ family lipoprotein n=1 Tax=Limnoglobus roseus TaxID=2598579 RepID=A0A5C1AD72_9BACT|nr:YceK/YidQ family lipoprotein [Limnoglobus roseus]QEL17251.1 YceK/YidQ family lipoprotein [Limnoglobus roseus]
MSPRLLVLVTAAVAILSSGCGTTLNTCMIPQNGGQRVYGGVRLDATCVASAVTDEPTVFNPLGTSKPKTVYQRAWEMLLFGIDLPLSAIGDTVTLPYFLLSDVNNSINNYYFPPKKSAVEVPDALPSETAPMKLAVTK